VGLEIQFWLVSEQVDCGAEYGSTTWLGWCCVYHGWFGSPSRCRWRYQYRCRSGHRCCCQFAHQFRWASLYSGLRTLCLDYLLDYLSDHLRRDREIRRQHHAYQPQRCRSIRNCAQIACHHLRVQRLLVHSRIGLLRPISGR
ncbi:MAG: hypothetical protein M1823_007846, partial [Watsoniomyces obsoletus]